MANAIYTSQRVSGGDPGVAIYGPQRGEEAPVDPAGFDFDTAAGCIFGAIVGALTGISRASAVDFVVRVYNGTTGALVATSGTLTTGSNGRLPRWTHASLVDGTTYDLVFKRVSDGAIGCLRMGATT